MRLSADRRTLIVLSFALVVVTLGYGIVIPVFPFVIERLGGSGRDMGILVALAALTELLFAPIWGGISDRVGRKRILMVGIAGYGLSRASMTMTRCCWPRVCLSSPRPCCVRLRSLSSPSARAAVSARHRPHLGRVCFRP